MQPLISVIVATYKHDDMLLRALNSLASQTYRNFEIIVVDDNANEEFNSRVNDVITKFRQENENIKLNYIVNKTNLGSAKTRNVGIDASNGEYITFLDDDDLYLPENLEKQIENMLKTDADYGLTDIILYYDDESLCEQRIRNYIKSYKKEDYDRKCVCDKESGRFTFDESEHLVKRGERKAFKDCHNKAHSSVFQKLNGSFSAFCFVSHKNTSLT